MLQSTLLQKLQVFFVATTTVGVWGNFVLNHPKQFPMLTRIVGRKDQQTNE
jgi:hypothetical protein